MNKTSAFKKIAAAAAAVIAAAAIIAAAFFCGYYYRGKVNSTEDSLEWLVSIINSNYYQDVSTEDIYEYSAKQFVAEYLDQYSAYYTAEEYDAVVQSNAGSKYGIGLNTSYVAGSGVLVNSVIFNSPAHKSGLAAGSFITSASCGGESTQFSSSSQFNSYVTALEDGVTATYYTADGGEYDITKCSYTASYVTCATNSSAWAFWSEGENTPALTEVPQNAIEYLPDGAGYICISQFYGKVSSQFARAVETLNAQGCTSLILDLRSNGGGYVSDMQKIAACFTSAQSSSKVVAMTAKYKSGTESNFYTDSEYVTSQSSVVGQDMDVYILANGGTASASEALIGVLVSYGIADYSDIYLSDYSEEYLETTGLTADSAKSCRTYGKGIMQSTYVNSSTGEALKLTTAQIYWPNGTTIHGAGVTAADGANTVSAPYPSNSTGEELQSAVKLIYNL